MHLPKVILSGFVLLFLYIPAKAQSPVFYHLSTAEGLSDNNVNSACMDKNGILWIATTEGLNSFDGNRINTYHNYQYPLLASNDIDEIINDKHNNLWLITNTPDVSMLDKNRNFHLFTIGDTTNNKSVNELFATSVGMIALKDDQQYICSNPEFGVFKKLNYPFKDILPKSIRFIRNFSDDIVIFYGDDRLVAFNYASMQMVLDFPIKKISGFSEINDTELLAYTLDGDVFYRISITQKKIINEYRNLFDQYNKPIEGNLRSVARIDSNKFVFTSRFSGLYYLDLNKESLEHYTHDPLDLRSIGGNNTFRISYDSSGYLMVTTQTSGLHYYNVKQQQASSKPYFINEKSEPFDGYIKSILSANDSIIWMGAQDRLIRWNRKKDLTNYISCYLPDGRNISKEETIRALLIDDNGNLWVGTSRYGILVLNQQFKTIAQLKQNTTDPKSGLPADWINTLCTDKKGNRWVGTTNGISIVEKNSFKVISLKNHPLLARISNIHCVVIWVDSKSRVWIGSKTGAYCYDEKNNSLKHYTTADGLSHNTVYSINEDNYGNTYFGTVLGLSILSKDGTIKSYNRSNGLLNDKCEGILKDENGFIWIGNLNCILRFDPVNKKFIVFEEGYGFSHAGFRMRSCFKSESGEMFWGSDKGLTWFFPNQMNIFSLHLRPSINTLYVGKKIYRFTVSDSISFPFNTSSFVFQFASGELTGGKKTKFHYRLRGFDNEWNTPVTTGQVAYNNLPSGKYIFEIEASYDGINWVDGSYTVMITIDKPWWQQNWFRLLYLTTAAISLLVLYNNYRKRKKTKEAMNKAKMELMELNVKIAESKFMNLRLQMNPHFLFNSLSSIQVLIVSQKTTEAYKYLTLFSNFLRSLLNYADKNFMPLDEELKVLKMYIELESLRFDKTFSFEINVDETLSNDEILVPSLMVQPFVENAIWHGLLHKEGDKKLSIQFINHLDEYLTCSIEDNGIGRFQSDIIQKNKIKSIVHHSKGIAIIKERLSLLQQKTGKPAHVEVIDLFNHNSEASGTKIIITIPYYNPEE